MNWNYNEGILTIYGSGKIHDDSAHQLCWNSNNTVVENTKTIILDHHITSIGHSAFYGFSKLMDITLHDGITTIGDKSFYGCTSLTNIIIPSNVETIGRNAFSGCTNLISVTYFGEYRMMYLKDVMNYQMYAFLLISNIQHFVEK